MSCDRYVLSGVFKSSPFETISPDEIQPHGAAWYRGSLFAGRSIVGI